MPVLVSKIRFNQFPCHCVVSLFEILLATRTPLHFPLDHVNNILLKPPSNRFSVSRMLLILILCLRYFDVNVSYVQPSDNQMINCLTLFITLPPSVAAAAASSYSKPNPGNILFTDSSIFQANEAFILRCLAEGDLRDGGDYDSPTRSS